MDRAYARLETKGIAGRRFSGIATTPTPDRDGHSIDLAGVTFTNPVPLLWYHDQKQPIGLAWLTKTPDAITFDAEIVDVAEPGALKTRTDEATHSIGAGVIRGVSIGFRTLGKALERLSSGLLRIKALEICELSLVAIPSNVDATILTIKAASGRDPLGVSSSICLGSSMKTIQESIGEWTEKRATTAAAMVALMTKATDAGETLAGDDATKYDELGAEIVRIDEQLDRLTKLETINKSAAVPVIPKAPGIVTTLAPKVPPGAELAMVAMCLGRARGDKMLAIEFAKEFAKECPNVELFLKAAVAPGTTTDPAWAGALVPSVAPVGNSFLNLLRPKTIIGRISGLRRVPFNTYLPRVTDGGSVGWVGEGAKKKVTKQAFDKVQIGEAKAAAIVVLTDELVRRSNPDAISTVQGIMIDTMVAFLDGQFIDPAVAAVAGVHPASITNGLTPIPSTSPDADLAALLGAFATANIPLSSVTVIMSDTNAIALALMKTSTGVPLFPGMTVNGGTLPGGLSVVTSQTAGSNIIALAPELVMFAEEGILLDVSREASVEMSDAPDGTGGLVSLWQQNMVGLRVERYINWQRARNEAVAYVSGAAYPLTGSPSA